jgi:phosphoglycerate dehydrogenase-like enzyme
MGCELHGRTLGVLGLGRLGREMAAIGRAFGMNIIAWSQNLTAQNCAEAGALLVDKQSLFRRSDVLSIHVVLGERTRGLIGKHELSLMKPTAFLVNTSRGPIVDEAALLDCLHRGQIAGAGLDVYDREPLPADHPLRKAPRTLLTPHIGITTEENYRTYYGQAVEDIRAFQAGRPIRVLN